MGLFRRKPPPSIMPNFATARLSCQFNDLPLPDFDQLIDAILADSRTVGANWRREDVAIGVGYAISGMVGHYAEALDGKPTTTGYFATDQPQGHPLTVHADEIKDMLDTVMGRPDYEPLMLLVGVTYFGRLGRSMANMYITNELANLPGVFHGLAASGMSPTFEA